MIQIDDITVISLDLETGGLIPGKHTPLSIGAVILPTRGNLPMNKNKNYEITKENSFYVQLEWDTITIDPKALLVNELDIINPPGPDGGICDRSLPVDQGLVQFFDWLFKHTFKPIYALGMNVGSFDLAMLRPIWKGRWPFHYRSIDLNGLFFAVAQVQNKSFDIVKREITDIAWSKLKRQHTILTDSLGVPLVHHALTDAWSNIYIWEECLRRFHGDCEVMC